MPKYALVQWGRGDEWSVVETHDIQTDEEIKVNKEYEVWWRDGRLYNGKVLRTAGKSCRNSEWLTGARELPDWGTVTKYLSRLKPLIVPVHVG